MLTSYALLAPVLPTLLVDEHRRHYTPMLTALAEASKRFFAETPAVVVVLSARWNAPGPFRAASALSLSHEASRPCRARM